MSAAARVFLAELAGTAALLAVVVGSGIMGQTLSPGNLAVALLGNSLATAAALAVLISLLGPVSGAHLNPLVTLMAWADRGIDGPRAVATLAAQLLGSLLGVFLAHAMFGLPVLQSGIQPRASAGLWLGEVVATVALLATIRGCRGPAAARPEALVPLVILAGYWATSSTCFANPAVTLARSLTATFAGIRPEDVAGFVLAQLVGLGLVLLVARLRR